ncbi:eukaryotic translation initiation factor 5, partial [Coemansia sp. RSA 2618]
SPETDLVLTKEQTIIRRCMACGQPSNVDMSHKLSTYILKNPPPKEKKAGKHASAQNNGSANASGDEELDQLARDAAALAVSGDDDDWGYDEDAVNDEMAPAGAFAAGAEENDEDPFEQLADFIEANADASDDDALFAKATELGLAKKHRALVVVIQCLFTGSTKLVKDIVRHKRLLTRFGDSEKHQRAVIGGFERLIEADIDARLTKTPAVLKALFDEDIVDEEVLLEWGRRPSKKYVEKDAAKRIHKAAQPFIEWLETAESESDSDSE